MASIGTVGLTFNVEQGSGTAKTFKTVKSGFEGVTSSAKMLGMGASASLGKATEGLSSMGAAIDSGSKSLGGITKVTDKYAKKAGKGYKTINKQLGGVDKTLKKSLTPGMKKLERATKRSTGKVADGFDSVNEGVGGFNDALTESRKAMVRGRGDASTYMNVVAKGAESAEGSMGNLEGAIGGAADGMTAIGDGASESLDSIFGLMDDLGSSAESAAGSVSTSISAMSAASSAAANGASKDIKGFSSAAVGETDVFATAMQGASSSLAESTVRFEEAKARTIDTANTLGYATAPLESAAANASTMAGELSNLVTVSSAVSSKVRSASSGVTSMAASTDAAATAIDQSSRGISNSYGSIDRKAEETTAVAQKATKDTAREFVTLSEASGDVDKLAASLSDTRDRSKETGVSIGELRGPFGLLGKILKGSVKTFGLIALGVGKLGVKMVKLPLNGLLRGFRKLASVELPSVADLTGDTTKLMSGLESQVHGNSIEARKYGASLGFTGQRLKQFSSRASSLAISMNRDADSSGKAVAAMEVYGETLKSMGIEKEADVLKLSELTGMDSFTMAEMFTKMRKETGMSGEELRAFVDSTTAVGATINDVQGAFANVETRWRTMRDLAARGYSTEEVNDYVRGLDNLSVAYSSSTEDASGAVAFANALGDSFVEAQRNLENMRNGLESDMPGLAEHLGVLRGDVGEAFADIEKGPEAFAASLGGVFLKMRDSGKPAAQIEADIAQVKSVLTERLKAGGMAEDAATGLVNMAAAADEATIASLRAGERQSKNVQKLANEGFSVGRDLSGQMQHMKDSFEMGFRSIGRSASRSLVRDTGKQLRKFNKQMKAMSKEGGPLGQFITKMSEASQIGHFALMPEGMRPVAMALGSVYEQSQGLLDGMQKLGIKATSLVNPFTGFAVVVGGLALGMKGVTDKAMGMADALAGDPKRLRRANKEYDRIQNRLKSKWLSDAKRVELQERALVLEEQIANATLLANASTEAGRKAAEELIKQGVMSKYIGQLREQLSMVTEMLVGVIKEAPAIIKDVIKVFKENGPDIAMALTSGLNELGTAIREQLTMIDWEAVDTYLLSAIDDILTGSENTFIGVVVNWASKVFNTAWEFLSKIDWKGIYTFLGAVYSRVYDAWQDFDWERLVNAFKSVTWKEVADTIAAGLRFAGRWAFKQSSEFMTGLLTEESGGSFIGGFGALFRKIWETLLANVKDFFGGLAGNKDAAGSIGGGLGTLIKSGYDFAVPLMEQGLEIVAQTFIEGFVSLITGADDGSFGSQLGIVLRNQIANTAGSILEGVKILASTWWEALKSTFAGGDVFKTILVALAPLGALMLNRSFRQKVFGGLFSLLDKISLGVTSKLANLFGLGPREVIDDLTDLNSSMQGMFRKLGKTIAMGSKRMNRSLQDVSATLRNLDPCKRACGMLADCDCAAYRGFDRVGQRRGGILGKMGFSSSGTIRDKSLLEEGRMRNLPPGAASGAAVGGGGRTAQTEMRAARTMNVAATELDHAGDAFKHSIRMFDNAVDSFRSAVQRMPLGGAGRGSGKPAGRRGPVRPPPIPKAGLRPRPAVKPPPIPPAGLRPRPTQVFTPSKPPAFKMDAINRMGRMPTPPPARGVGPRRVATPPPIPEAGLRPRKPTVTTSAAKPPKVSTPDVPKAPKVAGGKPGIGSRLGGFGGKAAGVAGAVELAMMFGAGDMMGLSEDTQSTIDTVAMGVGMADIGTSLLSMGRGTQAAAETLSAGSASTARLANTTVVNASKGAVALSEASGAAAAATKTAAEGTGAVAKSTRLAAKMGENVSKTGTRMATSGLKMAGTVSKAIPLIGIGIAAITEAPKIAEAVDKLAENIADPDAWEQALLSSAAIASGGLTDMVSSLTKEVVGVDIVKAAQDSAYKDLEALFGATQARIDAADKALKATQEAAKLSSVATQLRIDLRSQADAAKEINEALGVKAPEGSLAALFMSGVQQKSVEMQESIKLMKEMGELQKAMSLSKLTAGVGSVAEIAQQALVVEKYRQQKQEIADKLVQQGVVSKNIADQLVKIKDYKQFQGTINQMISKMGMNIDEVSGKVGGMHTKFQGVLDTSRLYLEGNVKALQDAADEAGKRVDEVAGVEKDRRAEIEATTKTQQERIMQASAKLEGFRKRYEGLTLLMQQAAALEAEDPKSERAAKMREEASRAMIALRTEMAGYTEKTREDLYAIEGQLRDLSGGVLIEDAATTKVLDFLDNVSSGFKLDSSIDALLKGGGVANIEKMAAAFEKFGMVGVDAGDVLSLENLKYAYEIATGEQREKLGELIAKVEEETSKREAQLALEASKLQENLLKSTNASLASIGLMGDTVVNHLVRNREALANVIKEVQSVTVSESGIVDTGDLLLEGVQQTELQELAAGLRATVSEIKDFQAALLEIKGTGMDVEDLVDSGRISADLLETMQEMYGEIDPNSFLTAGENFKTMMADLERMSTSMIDAEAASSNFITNLDYYKTLSKEDLELELGFKPLTAESYAEAFKAITEEGGPDLLQKLAQLDTQLKVSLLLDDEKGGLKEQLSSLIEGGPKNVLGEVFGVSKVGEHLSKATDYFEQLKSGANLAVGEVVTSFEDGFGNSTNEYVELDMNESIAHIEDFTVKTLAAIDKLVGTDMPEAFGKIGPVVKGIFEETYNGVLDLTDTLVTDLDGSLGNIKADLNKVEASIDRVTAERQAVSDPVQAKQLDDTKDVEQQMYNAINSPLWYRDYRAIFKAEMKGLRAEMSGVNAQLKEIKSAKPRRAGGTGSGGNMNNRTP